MTQGISYSLQILWTIFTMSLALLFSWEWFNPSQDSSFLRLLGKTCRLVMSFRWLSQRGSSRWSLLLILPFLDCHLSNKITWRISMSIVIICNHRWIKLGLSRCLSICLKEVITSILRLLKLFTSIRQMEKGNKGKIWRLHLLDSLIVRKVEICHL